MAQTALMKKHTLCCLKGESIKITLVVAFITFLLLKASCVNFSCSSTLLSRLIYFICFRKHWNNYEACIWLNKTYCKQFLSRLKKKITAVINVSERNWDCKVQWRAMNCIIGLAKNLRFFCNILWKNSHKLFGQWSIF